MRERETDHYDNVGVYTCVLCERGTSVVYTCVLCERGTSVVYTCVLCERGRPLRHQCCVYSQTPIKRPPKGRPKSGLLMGRPFNRTCLRNLSDGVFVI